MSNESLPWSGCKIGFDIQDEEGIWAALDNPRSNYALPRGWSLSETDSLGTRAIAIFDVEVMPTVEDGLLVAKILKDIDTVKE